MAQKVIKEMTEVDATSLTHRWSNLTIKTVEDWLENYYLLYPEKSEWKSVYHRFFSTYVEMIRRCSKSQSYYSSSKNFTFGMVDHPFYIDEYDSAEHTTFYSGSYRKYLDFPCSRREDLFYSAPHLIPKVGGSDAEFWKIPVEETGPVRFTRHRHGDRRWICITINGHSFLLFSTRQKMGTKETITRVREIMKNLYCFEVLLR